MVLFIYLLFFLIQIVALKIKDADKGPMYVNYFCYLKSRSIVIHETISCLKQAII